MGWRVSDLPACKSSRQSRQRRTVFRGRAAMMRLFATVMYFDVLTRTRDFTEVGKQVLNGFTGAYPVDAGPVPAD